MAARTDLRKYIRVFTGQCQRGLVGRHQRSLLLLLALCLAVFMVQRTICPRVPIVAARSPASQLEELSHPLWTPPTLCNASSSQYPGLTFCPPVRVPFFREIMAGFSPPVPENYWMLDAPAILATIARKVKLSKWLVNIGAEADSPGEDGERRIIKGDDCSPLWPMGYRGVNFDVPQKKESMNKFYGKWPKATVDTNGWRPDQIVDALHRHGVPLDIDFLKIDVDSFDCQFLSAVLSAGYRPKVINIESFPVWPPPIRYMTVYSEEHPYGDSVQSALMGCSVQMVLDIVRPYNYTMLQFALQDSWLVSNHLIHLFGTVERDPVKLFHLGNPNLYGAHHFRPKTGDAKKLIEELISLRSKPDKMLARAKELVQNLLDWRPALRRVRYELSVAAK